MSQGEQLARLQHLLENLPKSVPYHNLGSTCYSFSVGEGDIEEYGDEASATNHRLEVVFGSRHDTGGIVPIKERGPGIHTVVPFLEKCPPADARIALWIENLCSSAEKLYTEAGEKVRVHPLVLRQ